MLTFESYREKIEELRDEVSELEDKIEYRKLMIRKMYYLPHTESLSIPTIGDGSVTTVTTASISISTMPSGYRPANSIDNIYDNDDELAKLRYKLSYAKRKLDYLRANGDLPD